MTQTELAYAIGSDAANVSTLEAGKRDAQSYKVAALAMVLACSADYLLNLTDDPTPHSRGK